ncbi:hypothetical protein BV898_09418 [Hypsibius exemplaris]|uniref:Uncharacterized protein n=1 Tax=Hypsibius exemplaris TaxID=2072580 RepID=A0A1W0WMP6_HYPEX|nr:hypothetical protein BV898_09418 [Hypsibius exemplaris]
MNIRDSLTLQFNCHTVYGLVQPSGHRLLSSEQPSLDYFVASSDGLRGSSQLQVLPAVGDDTSVAHCHSPRFMHHSDEDPTKRHFVSRHFVPLYEFVSGYTSYPDISYPDNLHS